MQKTLHLVLAISLLFIAVSCNTANKDTFQLIPIQTENGYQYIDMKGEVAIDSHFVEATLFTEGLALVQNSRAKQAWGYIDLNGKYIIEPLYEQATSFSEGIAWVVVNDSAPLAIDTKGKSLFVVKNVQKARNFSQGLAAVEITDSVNLFWGYLNTKGQFSIVPQFEEAYPFKQGIALVKSEGKYGFINPKGEFIIQAQYTDSNLAAYFAQTATLEIRPHTEVETDYFDKDEVVSVLASVVNRANSKAVFNATFGDVVKEYGIDKNVFSKYENHSRIANVSISQVLGYDIYIEGQPWKKTGKETYVFVPDTKIKAFFIYIQLSQGGEGKASSIFDACNSAFVGYTKNAVESNEFLHVFTKGKQKISVWRINPSSMVVRMGEFQ